MPGFSTQHGALPRLPDLGLRVLVAAALVTGALATFEQSIVERLVPVMFLQDEIALLAPDFKILSVAIDRQAPTGKFHFRVRAYVSRPVQIKTHVLLPPGWHGLGPISVMECTFPPQVLEYCAMTLIVILGWPAVGVKEFLLRGMLSIPLMFCQFLIAVPAPALAALWQGVRMQMDAPGVNGWLLWSNSLDDGGGLVLGCLFGALAIVWAKGLLKPAGGASGAADDDG